MSSAGPPPWTLRASTLARHVVGARLERVRLVSPFVLRTVAPSLDELTGRRCLEVGRLGKRLVLGFEDGLFLVIHLMIAGRVRWKAKDAKLPGRGALAGFDWERGTLVFTEAGKHKRASLHAVRGRTGLAAHDRGGLDVRTASVAEFIERFTSKGHTLKRALCDPTIVDGVGNAYSDEILHRARLSPLQRVGNLDREELARLHAAAREVLEEWTERLAAAVGHGFPDKVTAFHPEMAVHGKFKQPCPDCGAPVQRIVRADNELDYCPGCQTGGRILRDRALSQLLKDDWPRSLDELQ